MDGFNRALWTVIGVLLLGAGAGGLLIGAGVFGPLLQTARVSPTLLAELDRPGRPALLDLGLGGGLALLLGLLLLRAEVPVRRLAGIETLRLPRPRTNGTATGSVTIVRGSALQQGLERDLERIPGIERARALLAGAPDGPTLRVRLDVDAYADLLLVRARVQRALERLATTTGSAPTSVEVTVRVRDARRRFLPAG